MSIKLFEARYIVPLVYVLELEDGCWYVGYSENIHRRLAQHFQGEGAIWCKLHKPVRVHEIIPLRG